MNSQKPAETASRVKLLIAIFLLCGSLEAQQIHVTADLLSPSTTAAMFGKLPKPYSAANVSVCNQTNAPLTIALALAAQQTRLSGVVMLPRDAALSVIAAAQGSATGSRILRASITAVQLAAIAAGWSTLSSAFKNALTSAALAGSSAVSILSTTIPTHTYLVFTNEALPDPLQLAAFGCATGTIIVETATGTTKVDAVVSLPSGPGSGR
jgi:hypothetical protein